MHPNPIFRADGTDPTADYARARGFGILSINGPDGPLLAHIPFILNDAATKAYGHLVRSNSIWRALEKPQKAVLAVSGGDTYISPDWYGVPDQVPTWNYVAVHLRGTLERMPREDLLQILDSTSARFEPELAPKPPWTTAKMTPEVLKRMMRQIVPIRLDIADIQGTWKLSQNKSAEARQGVVEGLKTSPIGQHSSEIAALMAQAIKDETP